MIGRQLAQALAQAAQALERGDPILAATVLEEAARVCAAAAASGARLEGAALAEARELHARCGTAAQRAAERLEKFLADAGCARRAVAAYDHRGTRALT